MNKNFTKLIVLLFAFVIGSGNMWADVVTFDASKDVTNVTHTSYTNDLTTFNCYDGSTWKAIGFQETQYTWIGPGQGGANYLETPEVNGTITSVAVTWSGNTSYYLALQTTDGIELDAKRNPSSSSTEIFNVSGSYSKLRLVGRRSSGTSNALAKIEKVVVTYTSGGGGGTTTYTVTLGDDNSTLTQSSAGASVTLPTRDGIGDYLFEGWSETNVENETTTAPTIIPAGNYTPTADITLYPVYSRIESGSGPTNANASVTISEYASTNNWISGSNNGPQYKVVVLNEDITATTTGTGNNGKYYNDWRFYQNGNGNVIITTSNGELSYVTFTFTVSNGGTLNYNSSAITNGTAVEVSGTSAEFIVGNSGSATNGQVRITAISVNYTTTGSTTTYYWSWPVVSTEASVTVTPSTITAPAEGATGTLSLTYENISNFSSFDYNFCDAEGNDLQEDPNWIDAEINEENDTYSLDYLIDPNEGEARTAYMKVYTFDDAEEEVYAIVTVNQAEFVVDYATLPFEWEEGDYGTTPAGITNSNVSTGSSNAYLKFDGSGDYIILKINERPGELSFEIKANPSDNTWDGIFKVQASENGTNYTDVLVYNGDNMLDLSEYQEVSLSTLSANIRYIKWVYIEKVKGNVALKNIVLDEYQAPQPAITLSTYAISATNEETDGTVTVTYTNVESSVAEVVICDANGNETTYDWFDADFDNDYNVYYTIDENNGAARTAYFKVYSVDAELNDVYSDLVTVSQAAVPQHYTLEVTSISNAEIFVFNATDPDETNWVYLFEGIDEVQVLEGTPIALSVSADQGYVIESLMVNDVNHVADIDGGEFTFTMPAENVIITVTAVENVAPGGGNYVRITNLNQLTDGSKVIIAARYDEDHPNGYYAMPGQTTSKPNGVAFTSETSGNDEILPATFTASEDDYYWTVNVTNDGYTFTNVENQMIGYSSGTNFATGGNNTEWTITRETAARIAMVAEYSGFVIRNGNNSGRAFAFNGTAFGAYATSNMTNSYTASGYNFCLDFFVQNGEPASATVNYGFTINPYTVPQGTTDNPTDGWYLISSPVTEDITPSASNGFLTNTYDLYRFNQDPTIVNGVGKEWENFKNHNSFSIKSGKGYLYANSGATTLTFAGTPNTNSTQTVHLDYTEGAQFAGVNLVGNPFPVSAISNKSYYVMNSDRTGIEANATSAGTPIAPYTGVIVVATDTDRSVTFTKQTRSTTGATNNNGYVNLVLSQQMNRGIVNLDKAIVSFNEGDQLGKFYFGSQDANLYIAMSGKDYAIVSTEAQGEMPVNFRANEDGQYTLTVNPENVDMNYLHLIDNMTGMDVDLLQTPSYTFNATIRDYESRFKLVFASNGASTSSASDETFAFYSNGNWIINNAGEATLQVIDVNGRILSSETVNGSVSTTINAVPGVYMLRLINGENVNVQKILVR